MICYRCKIKMKIGQGIYTESSDNVLHCVSPGCITYDQLKLVDVWKCPECGHSEDIKDLKNDTKTCNFKY